MKWDIVSCVPTSPFHVSVELGITLYGTRYQVTGRNCVFPLLKASSHTYHHTPQGEHSGEANGSVQVRTRMYILLKAKKGEIEEIMHCL